jgi:hypothetical protein
MTIADIAARAPKLAGQNVLILDIERMKGSATIEFWDLGDFKNRRIHADDVTLWPRTICAAWAWYGDDRVGFSAEWGKPGREGMLTRLWSLYDKAQIVVGHNIKGFDTKKLKAEWAAIGLTPPSPFKQVDTLTIARREFGFESNTLDSLCKRFGITAKDGRYDVEVARAALGGCREAQRTLKSYNCGDIAATLGLYDHVRPWDKTHPHSVIGMSDDRPTCHACWGDDLELNGFTLANLILYRLYRCRACGANVKGSRHSRAAVTRGA